MTHVNHPIPTLPSHTFERSAADTTDKAVGAVTTVVAAAETRLTQQWLGPAEARRPPVDETRGLEAPSKRLRQTRGRPSRTCREIQVRRTAPRAAPTGPSGVRLWGCLRPTPIDHDAVYVGGGGVAVG